MRAMMLSIMLTSPWYPLLMTLIMTLMWLNVGRSSGSSAQQRVMSWCNSLMHASRSTTGRKGGSSGVITRATISEVSKCSQWG
uniref:Putative secreted protein n=1 Tax=Ixodes ricinus TaxID=34613 RepID=A0A6B0U7G6_IXORI